MNSRYYNQDTLIFTYMYGHVYATKGQLCTLQKKVNPTPWWKWSKPDPTYIDALHSIKTIFELVEVRLGLFPDKNNFDIICYNSVKELDISKQAAYGKDVRNLGRAAYTSLNKNTMHIAINKMTARVLAHEFGHLILQSSMNVRPSRHLHEIVAQFSEGVRFESI